MLLSLGASVEDFALFNLTLQQCGIYYQNTSMQEGLIYLGRIQVPVVASNRIGKEVTERQHGKSEITFYGNSFIAGTLFISFGIIEVESMTK